jgi:hypothetical protein
LWNAATAVERSRFAVYIEPHDAAPARSDRIHKDDQRSCREEPLRNDDDATSPDDPESYPTSDGYPAGLEQLLPPGARAWGDSVNMFSYWFEREIVEGRMPPFEVDSISET